MLFIREFCKKKIDSINNFLKFNLEKYIRLVIFTSGHVELSYQK